MLDFSSFNCYHRVVEAFAVKVRLVHVNFNLRIYTTKVSSLLAVFDPRKTHAQNTHITASYRKHTFKVYAIDRMQGLYM